MEERQINDLMRPSKNSHTVAIPVTFSKRSEGTIDKKALFWVLLVSTGLFLILLIGVLSGSLGWYFKIPLAIVLLWAYLFILRYFVFGEGRVSDAYEAMKENDYSTSTNVFWNIYDINDDGTSPHVVHYANGIKGVFVRFDKDVVVGKENYKEFSHFEALGNMYNIAHELGLDLVNLDFMDSVTNDERMNDVHRVSSNASNPDLKAILSGMFSHLESEMSRNFTNFDVYLFTTRGDDKNLFYNVRKVVEYGLKANYKSHTILNKEDIRRAARSIMNLEDFSIIQASEDVIKGSITKRVRPIRLVNEDSSVQIINKTREELKQDLEKRKQSKTKKKGKDNNSGSKEVMIDLFEDDSALARKSIEEDKERKMEDIF